LHHYFDNLASQATINYGSGQFQSEAPFFS